jgi:hypothetical protein
VPCKPYVTGNVSAIDMNEEEDQNKQSGVAGPEVRLLVLRVARFSEAQSTHPYGPSIRSFSSQNIQFKASCDYSFPAEVVAAPYQCTCFLVIKEEYKHVGTGNSMAQLDESNYSESVTGMRNDIDRHRDRRTYRSLSEGG